MSRPAADSHRPVLVASDLDGTLLGDDAALAAFAEWFTARRDRVTLAYATGRIFDEVCDLIATTPLPAPHAIIGAVGTDIRLYHGREHLSEWPTSGRQSWDVGLIRSALRDLPWLSLQPPNVQTAFKVSYFGDDLSLDQLAAVEHRLAGAGLTFDLIYSSRRDLDVLPHQTNKGRAVKFLADRLGVDAEHVVVCGDTGNDSAMFSQGFRGIVVGNAHPELKALVGERVYAASACCAAGVLEGLKHWEQRGVITGAAV